MEGSLTNSDSVSFSLFVQDWLESLIGGYNERERREEKRARERAERVTMHRE